MAAKTKLGKKWTARLNRLVKGMNRWHKSEGHWPDVINSELIYVSSADVGKFFAYIIDHPDKLVGKASDLGFAFSYRWNSLVNVEFLELVGEGAWVVYVSRWVA